MKLTLKNFQSHKESTIETEGGITAITGSTNAGKSSFIRAFNHIKSNNLRGTSYIKKGQTECKITLDAVEYTKSKSFTGYNIAGENDPLEALKTDVPPQIASELNLSPHAVQLQHDSIFLLNKSAGFCAQQLSELIDLEQAHVAVKLVDGERKDAYKELNITTAAISKHKDRIEELKGIDAISDTLAQIEQEAAAIRDMEEKHDNLCGVVNVAIERHNALSTLPEISKLDNCIPLLETATNIKDRLRELDSLSTLISTLKETQAKRMTMPDFNKAIVEIEKDISSFYDIEETIIDITTYQGQIVKQKAALKAHQDRLETIVAESKVGGLCPLCGAQQEE